MISINIHEAKTHLSHYLDLALSGEHVVICKRNIPIAELNPIKQNKPKRYIGGSKYKVEIPDSFFEPLSDEMIDLFEGNNPDDPLKQF